MKKTVQILGRAVEVELSKLAEKNLKDRKHHLCLEMELYFSCMIRKQVNVRAAIDNGMSVFVNDKLEIGFRPVMTKACSVSSCNGESPPVSDFPITKAERYIPHWLKVDFKKGRWTGEFGYWKEAELVAV
jgi:hypothetical protein